MSTTIETLEPTIIKSGVTTFLRDTFFPTPVTHISDEIEIELYKNGQVVAPYVAEGVSGINMEREASRQKTFKIPLVAPQRPVSKALITGLGIGENIYSTKTPEQRADEILQRDVEEMDASIIRREEVMCAELLSTGKIVVTGYADYDDKKPIIKTIGFEFKNSMDVHWTAENSMLNDMRMAVTRIRQGGNNPTTAVVGSEIADLLIRNQEIYDLLNNRNISIGNLSPQFVEKSSGNGYTYLGFCIPLGLHIYAYNAWYRKNKTLTPYIPDQTMVIGCEGCGEMHYGSITQMNAEGEFETHEAQRVYKTWVNVGSDNKMQRVASKPLPIIEDTSSWFILNNNK